MIDKVIVCGLRRGKELISKIDFNQFIGRSGRSYNKSGKAILMISDKDEIVGSDYLFGELPPVISSMNEIEKLSFHILPLIKDREVVDEQTFMNWYSKSLSYIQGNKVHYNELVSFLINLNCVYIKDNLIFCTELGEISSELYFHPKIIKNLQDKLNKIKSENIIYNKYTLSWMMANKSIIVNEKDDNSVLEYKCKCNSFNCHFKNNELIHGYLFFCLMSGIKPKWMKILISQEISDIARYLNLIKKVCEINHININKEIDAIMMSINKNIDFDMVKLMIETKIDKKSDIIQLFNIGIDSVEKIIDYEYKIKNNCSKEVVEKLKCFWI